MNWEKNWFRWMCAAWLGMGICLLAGEFAPPAEGPIPFRRDQIPLDPDTMELLSKNLEIMALGMPMDSPEHRRGTAQMLALALAVDPGNAKARSRITRLVKERSEDRPTEDDRLAKARVRAWQYASWLETPEAGSSGRALAACLKDVLVVSDPEDPRAEAMRGKPQTGDWNRWIPPLSAYQEKTVASNTGTNGGGIPEDVSSKVDPDRAARKILAKAEVQTLLWQKLEKGESAPWVLARGPLTLSAKLRRYDDDDGSPRASVVIGSDTSEGMFSRLGRRILQLISTDPGDLPKGLSIRITSEELENSAFARRRQSITAAAAVLASAAVTGREPQAVIIGQISETGDYALPSGFWYQLRALGEGQGQRLVLPIAAAADLPSVLAMEKPGFFLDYEVVLASNWQELRDFSAKEAQGALAGASAKFREIRDRRGNQDLRQYISNRFVRQRLGEVVQEFPEHFSARMLLVQSAGNRPAWVTRAVLAAELRRAIEPMNWLVRHTEWGFSSDAVEKLGETYNECRDNVNALERYAENSDQELVDGTLELVSGLRNVDRATRTRGEDYMVIAAVQAAKASLIKQHSKWIAELDTESGDP